MKTADIKPEKSINPENLSTITNLVKEWGISRPLVYNWIRKGIIKEVEHCGARFVDKSTFKPRMSKGMLETIIANYSKTV